MGPIQGAAGPDTKCGKILIGFMQVVANLAGLPKVQWPVSWKNIIARFSFVEIKLDVPSTACLMGGFTYYSKLLGYTLAPLAVVFLLSLPSFLAYIRSMRGRQQRLDQ